MYKIQKIAVLGSGVMGGQIAAHCANAGYQVLLLDMKTEGDANKIAKESIKKMQKMNPAPFALPEFSSRIQPGNFDDHFHLLAEMDWICEVIVERMDIKQSMLGKIDAVRKPGSIISSNTSGLPITQIAEHVSEDLKKHFLGTHFFNPPRYMNLLEIIPTEHTETAITHFMTDFCEKILGKGVVICKDTPNFIANRIGVYSMASILPHAFKGSLRIEEIDALTGTLTGYSKAATFRTGDMVGLDVLAHVANNILPQIPHDEQKDVFNIPSEIGEMIQAGLLGNKSGAGFYKKEKTKQGTQFLVFNSQTKSYEEQHVREFESVKEAQQFKKSGNRLAYLINQKDDAGSFLWEVHRDLFLYAANRIPEISDSIENIDRAMCWGFNWELGPFQKWDACGVRKTVERILAEGKQVPNWVLHMLSEGYENFYSENGQVYNPLSHQNENQSPVAKNALFYAHLKTEKREVFAKKDAALYDLGDGIAGFEIRSKANTLGREVVESLFQAIELSSKDFQGLVIGTDTEHFSVGANLMEVGGLVQAGDFAGLNAAVKGFQDAALALKYAPIPTVAAIHGRCLGGGVEWMMHTDKVVAHHELYAGLVEIGVGLLPAGGGTKELTARYLGKMMEADNVDPLVFLREAFKVIGMARVSTSAHEAKKIGYLRDTDIIVMNRALLLKEAKAEAIRMAERGYVAPPKSEITLYGQTAFSALKLMMYIMKESGFISAYDAHIGEEISRVMTGGMISEPQKVNEQTVLDLEREAFVELLKNPKTHERIKHMLETGKPLRN
ncbi:3-hydroxyacyl-CoA dehydrogenase/enoyl-CoA hydratase family protein [bacterium]|nr:MAG: 3-hydroxyacyl-CoA dehydrogenase/enoyl-CoA hydratase family protein [bacterium]